MPKFVPRFAVYAGVCGAAIVLGAAFGKSELVFKIAAYVLFVTMFVEMMLSFHKSERIPFQDLALVFTAGIVIPWMLSSLVRLGLNDPKAPYLLLPFVITWLSDSGAFFVGRSLGKTKLAPALSPHKTVEGCVGGFVCAIAAAMLYGLVLHLCLLAGLGNIEQNRALVAVEIVVQAAGLFQKQRRRNAKQIQLRGELILKQTFEQADGLLRVINAEQALIALGDIGVHALFSSLSVSIRTSV